MQNLIDKFDAGYVISLADRRDRQIAVKREFRRIGLELPSSKIKLFLAEKPRTAGNFPGIGYRGSFSSHRRVLEMAKSRDLENVLVFEDDVSFRRVDNDLLENITSAIGRHDWDIFYFGYLSPSGSNLKGPLEFNPPDTIGGHFYAVNRSFFQPMIDYMYSCEKRPRDHPLGGPMGRDGAYNHVRYVRPETRVYLAVPNLAVQRSSRTDLHPLNALDRITLLQPVLNSLRGLKHEAWLQLDRLKPR